MGIVVYSEGYVPEQQFGDVIVSVLGNSQPFSWVHIGFPLSTVSFYLIL